MKQGVKVVCILNPLYVNLLRGAKVQYFVFFFIDMQEKCIRIGCKKWFLEVLLNKYAYFTIGREGRVKKMEKKDNLNRRWLALVQVVLDIGRR